MQKKLIQIGIKLIAALLGVLLLGAMPGLFNGMNLDLSGYVNRLLNTIQQLIHYKDLTFDSGEGSYQLFPVLFEYLTYSIMILFGALLIAFLAGLSFTILTLRLPAPLQKGIRRIAFLIESLPDVFILALVQISVIWIYKKTNVLIMDVASFERIYTMPILVLAILPTFLFYRIMIHIFEEEFEKTYVDLARTKGVNATRILFVHIFRNAILSIYFHSRSIVWFALSNLFIMEFIFNLNGLTRFIFEHPTPEIFTVSCVLLFVPIFVVLNSFQLIAERASKEEALI
ncbi:ABC transporter permease subunit [Pseudalkalibacillus hwajinpoensis]|uniref:ABC transporter permease subunit n=1 Tax=Guptibacillus hwajinpoensis TaxID=208199 RepID=UPI00325BCA33